jgi:hypothetical protein
MRAQVQVRDREGWIEGRGRGARQSAGGPAGRLGRSVYRERAVGDRLRRTIEPSKRRRLVWRGGLNVLSAAPRSSAARGWRHPFQPGMQRQSCGARPWRGIPGMRMRRRTAAGSGVSFERTVKLRQCDFTSSSKPTRQAHHRAHHTQQCPTSPADTRVNRIARRPCAAIAAARQAPPTGMRCRVQIRIKCLPLAPRTASRAIEWSSVASAPPCCTAEASR